MLIYKNYISKNILPILFIITAILTSLVCVTQTLRMVHLIDKGLAISDFLQLIIFIIPSLLFIILPIISVLAVIYTYNYLQSERQLIILRSAGLNNYALAKPALGIVILITIFAYYISAYLMPISYNAMKQKLSNFNQSYVSNIINAREFNQISKSTNIYVDSKNSNGSFSGIILFDNKIPENKTILFAKNAKIINSNNYLTELELTDGIRHSYDKFGNLTKLYFDNLIVTINNNETEANSRNKTSIELYISEMLWPDINFSTKKQQQLMVDGHLGIIWPLYNFAFAFFAISIFLNQPYNRKSNIKKFINTFIPILVIAYFHFTLQKMAYEEFNYIFLCYANLIFSVIYSLWQINKKNL